DLDRGIVQGALTLVRVGGVQRAARDGPGLVDRAPALVVEEGARRMTRRPLVRLYPFERGDVGLEPRRDPREGVVTELNGRGRDREVAAMGAPGLARHRQVHLDLRLDDRRRDAGVRTRADDRVDVEALRQDLLHRLALPLDDLFRARALHLRAISGRFAPR